MEVEQLERSTSAAPGRFYRPASRNRVNSMDGVVMGSDQPQQQQQQQRIRLASSVLSVATIIKTEPRSDSSPPLVNSPSASSIRRSRSRISTGYDNTQTSLSLTLWHALVNVSTRLGKAPSSY